MAVANLGRVSFVLQGEYDSAKAYTRLDVVNLNGFAYAAISDVPAGNPPPDTTYWQQMSVQGPEGTQGDPGPAGDSGVEVSTAQPTEDGTNLWINPNAIESISIPEIDDTTTSSEDTWSSQKIAQEIANAGGGGGSSYVLPVATSTVLGGVMPIAKTDEMTQAVGVDALGALFTVPGGGGSGGGSTWHVVGEQMMDGVESAVSYTMNGETIIQVLVVGAWNNPVTATKATISMKFADGSSQQFTTQTLDATQFAPKNLFLIVGSSNMSRHMIFTKGQGAAYASAQGSFGVSQGYLQNDGRKMTKTVDVTEITITFDQAPGEGTAVKVEGM